MTTAAQTCPIAYLLWEYRPEDRQNPTIGVAIQKVLQYGDVPDFQWLVAHYGAAAIRKWLTTVRVVGANRPSVNLLCAAVDCDINAVRIAPTWTNTMNTHASSRRETTRITPALTGVYQVMGKARRPLSVHEIHARLVGQHPTMAESAVSLTLYHLHRRGIVRMESRTRAERETSIEAILAAPGRRTHADKNLIRFQVTESHRASAAFAAQLEQAIPLLPAARGANLRRAFYRMILAAAPPA